MEIAGDPYRNTKKKQNLPQKSKNYRNLDRKVLNENYLNNLEMFMSKQKIISARVGSFSVSDLRKSHSVRIRIRNYSGPYFPELGLKTERYGVSLCIQSQCGKIRIRITPNTDTFHAMTAPNNMFKNHITFKINYF